MHAGDKIWDVYESGDKFTVIKGGLSCRFYVVHGNTFVGSLHCTNFYNYSHIGIDNELNLCVKKPVRVHTQKPMLSDCYKWSALFICPITQYNAGKHRDNITAKDLSIFDAVCFIVAEYKKFIALETIYMLKNVHGKKAF